MRIFDTNQIEYKPIIVKELQGQKLTSIDVSKNGVYLICGYTNGTIFMWDLGKNELAKTVIGIHQHAVIALKFLKGPKIWMMSADTNGVLYLTEYSKTIVGWTSASALLIKDRVIFSISPLYPDPLRVNPADDMCLVGIGGVNAVILVSMEPNVKILWEFKRKSSIRKAIPYIDWGKGALPGKPENSNIILAIAWDKVVQLVEIKDIRKGADGIEFNGFYESEYEIQTLWWLTDSVILVLTSTKELRILYSGKFSPGKYKEKTQEEILEAALMKKKGLAQGSPDLEPPYKITDELYMQVHNIERIGDLSNEQQSTLSNKNVQQNQMKNSYHQMLIVKNNEIIGLTKTGILSGLLLNWSYYLKCLFGKSSWLSLLRIGLEFYQGILKGFADLPEFKSMREPAVRNFMKEYIKQGLIKYLDKNRPANDPGQNLEILQITVEFCVNTLSYDYMFNELLNVFMEYKLENSFMATLEPYILSNQFKSVLIQRDIVYKQINYYVKIKHLDILERILLFLNLQGQDLEYLGGICVENKMFSALIYIKALQGNYQLFLEPAQCMLDELIKRQPDSENLIKKVIGNKEINDFVESSYSYLGYKLLWYIQICFKGEKFPQRTIRGDNKLTGNLWSDVVYSLLKWLLAEKDKICNLQHLIKVDAKVTFQVIGLLFETPELRGFITEPEKYENKFSGCAPIHFTELLKKLAIIAKDMDSAQTHSQYYFNLFLAHVSSQPGIKMETDLCISTAKSLIGYQVQNEQEESEFNELAHENRIIDMLQNCQKLTDSQIESLIKEASKSQYTEVLVFLTELRKDYSKCFEIYLNHPKWEKSMQIFDWLNKIKQNASVMPDELSIFPKLIYENIDKIVFFTF